MVCTFSPPGVSSAQANSFRAVVRSLALGCAMPMAMIAWSSAWSSSVTQWPSVENTRSAMFAAAALVKVTQRIFSGGTPSSSRRITRCTGTCVLPEPALAETKAEAAGSDARTCAARMASGIWRKGFTIARSPFLNPEAAGRRPLLDAGEVVIVAVTVRPHRQIERRIRLILVVELPDQYFELSPRIIGCPLGGRGGVPWPVFHF